MITINLLDSNKQQQNADNFIFMNFYNDLKNRINKNINIIIKYLRFHLRIVSFLHIKWEN